MMVKVMPYHDQCRHDKSDMHEPLDDEDPPVQQQKGHFDCRTDSLIGELHAEEQLQSHQLRLPNLSVGFALEGSHFQELLDLCMAKVLLGEADFADWSPKYQADVEAIVQYEGRKHAPVVGANILSAPSSDESQHRAMWPIRSA